MRVQCTKYSDQDHVSSNKSLSKWYFPTETHRDSDKNTNKTRCTETPPLFPQKSDDSRPFFKHFPRFNQIESDLTTRHSDSIESKVSHSKPKTSLSRRLGIVQGHFLPIALAGASAREQSGGTEESGVSTNCNARPQARSRGSTPGSPVRACSLPVSLSLHT